MIDFDELVNLHVMGYLRIQGGSPVVVSGKVKF